MGSPATPPKQHCKLRLYRINMTVQTLYTDTLTLALPDATQSYAESRLGLHALTHILPTLRDRAREGCSSCRERHNRTPLGKEQVSSTATRRHLAAPT